MFLFLLSHALSAWFAFFIPAYSTLKALARQAPGDQEVLKWVKYWTVIGTFVAFQYLTEWLLCWVPFYWEVKTLFLLYLALPQTEGSTYVFNTYLYPVFIKNQADIDAFINAMGSHSFKFLQTKIQALLNRASAGGNNSPLASAMNFIQSFKSTPTPKSPAPKSPTPKSKPTSQFAQEVRRTAARS